VQVDRCFAVADVERAPQISEAVGDNEDDRDAEQANDVQFEQVMTKGKGSLVTAKGICSPDLSMTGGKPVRLMNYQEDAEMHERYLQKFRLQQEDSSFK
jgi:hypothetical protein